MDDEDFASRVAGVAVLAEPIRRDLYRYVVAQSDPVSRDQAAEGVGVPRHTAKFHLDRLVEEGLLDTDFKRTTGREGPGAGRPSKRYRRSDRQVSVDVPDRRYELAGRLMARAIDEAARTGDDVVDALRRVAYGEGAQVAAALAGSTGVPAREHSAGSASAEDASAGDGDGLSVTCDVLAGLGYEPRRQDGSVLLVNCPFHALALEHTALVCGMNLALLSGLVAELPEADLAAHLAPSTGRCCVVLEPA